MDNVKPIQKAGYIHVKIPTKTHGIRIKAWKRKWLSLHQMSDLSAGKSVAKLDFYHDHGSSKKYYSILLDNVSAIKRSKSKTMEHAFDLLDDGPPLRFAGDSETECQKWIDALRDIFWPIEVTHPKIQPDAFIVSVIDNKDSEIHTINGRYVATVSPNQVGLLSVQDGSRVQSWKISTLKRFFITPPTTKQCDTNKTISFVAGVSPATDELYTFFCEEAVELLASIKRNVDVAFREKTKETEYHEVDDSVDLIDSWKSTSDHVDNLSTDSISSANNKIFLMLKEDDAHEDSSEEYSQLDFHKMPSVTGRRRSTFSGEEDFKKAGHLSHSRSASQLTVRFDCPEECIVDESGYTHLPASMDFSQNTNKGRSASNSSSVSQKSTSSRQSRDSGISIFKFTTEESEDVREFRNDSVDSAWGDLRADDIDTLSVSGKRAEQMENPKRSNSGYENIELQNGQNCDENDREEIYEDLDEIRKHKDLNTLLGVDRSFNLLEGNKKNLEKYLGYDETQKEKPPSLPDRPLSSKLHRKKTESPNKSRSKWNSIPLFTPFKASDPSRGRSFSTSSSGSEDEVNALIQKMGDWNDSPRTFVGDFKTKPVSVAQQSSFNMSQNNVVKNSLYADIKPETRSAVIQGDKKKPPQITERTDLLTDERIFPQLKEPPVADLLTFDSSPPPAYQNVIPVFNSSQTTTSATTNWTSLESHGLIGSPKNDDPFDMLYSFNPGFKTSPNENKSTDGVLTNPAVISRIESPKNDDPFDITWAQAILSPTKVESPSLMQSAATRVNEGNSTDGNGVIFSFDVLSNTNAKLDTYDSPVKIKSVNPFNDIAEVEEEFYMDMTQSPKSQRHSMQQNDDLYITMATK